MSDEWPLSEDACPTTTRRVSEMSWIQAMYSLRGDADEERVDWANRAAALEAEVAHLRAALEWLAKRTTSEWKVGCPSGVALCEDEHAEHGDSECVDCWITAALKAAEEGSDE